MIGSLFRDVLGLVDDVVTVATAPVVLAVEVAKEITSPLAEAARDAVEIISEKDSKR